MSKKLSNITFDSKFIYAEDEYGRKLKQSLLWYPALAAATEEQRKNYTTGFTGFHWRELDEDISFESFEHQYLSDVEPPKYGNHQESEK